MVSCVRFGVGGDAGVESIHLWTFRHSPNWGMVFVLLFVHHVLALENFQKRNSL